MSMPTITTSPNPISMSQAITDLIESIALEETALSHILNACLLYTSPSPRDTR